MESDSFIIKVYWQYKSGGESIWKWRVTQGKKIIANGSVWAVLPFAKRCAYRRAIKAADKSVQSISEEYISKHDAEGLQKRIAKLEREVGMKPLETNAI